MKILDYSQSTVSQHVKKLVNAGLLIIEKRDKSSIYSVIREKFEEYIDLLNRIK